jgi:hypothetical protein
MLSGIGSIDNVSGSARLSASVSFSINTARSVTSPKRSSDDSHAVSVVMPRVLVPAILTSPSSGSAAPVMRCMSVSAAPASNPASVRRSPRSSRSTSMRSGCVPP